MHLDQIKTLKTYKGGQKLLLTSVGEKKRRKNMFRCTHAEKKAVPLTPYHIV